MFVRGLVQSNFVLVGDSVAVIKAPQPKTTWREKDLFHLIVCTIYRGVSARTHRKDQEAGTEAEAMKECCLLTCSLWLAQSAFIYHPELSYQERYHPL